MSAIEIIERAVLAITNSADVYELCRNAVHSDLLTAGASGSSIVSVTQNGTLQAVASYGRAFPLPEGLSIWDDHPLTRGLAGKEAVSFDWEGDFVTLIPFYRTLAPVGGFLMTTKKKPSEFDASAKNILARLGAFYLEAYGLTSLRGAVRNEVSPEELSQRQREVLTYMSQGQTNAEIARIMLLSESTIRQETVRIYKALGVGGRAEASKKAKALGLISQVVAAG